MNTFLEESIMAITKILNINESPGEPTKHLKNAIDYICNPNKTRNGKLVGTLNCSRANVLKAMTATKEIFNKTEQRQGYHMILSFNPGEVDSDTAFQIMNEFAREYIGMNYECIFSVHEDKGHIHGHLVFNSVSCVDGLKFHYSNGDWAKEIQPITNRICDRYGLETIDVALPGVCRKESYAMWEDDTLRKTQPEIMNQLREKIDAFIKQSSSVDDMVDRLRNEGITVRYGKHLSLKLPGQTKGIRTQRLGFAYSLEAIEKRIKGEPIEMPKVELQEQDTSTIIRRAGYRASGTRYKLKNEQWKYKTEQAKLQMINKASTYMETNGIRTLQDIVSRKSQLQLQAEIISKERTQLFEERKGLQSAIVIIKNYPEEQAKELLKQQGYNPEEVFLFESNSAKQLENLYFQKRSVIREQNLLDDLETVYSKEQTKPILKDTK